MRKRLLSLHDLEAINKMLDGLTNPLTIPLEYKNGLKKLMDYYDISDNIAGNRSISLPSSNPPGTALPSFSYYTSPWSWTSLGSVAGNSGIGNVFWSVSDTSSETEEELRQTQIKAKQELDHRLRLFDALIDNVATVPATRVDNPHRSERSPDYVQTITGWRGWHVEEGKLKSIGTESHWSPRGVVPARCEGGGHHSAPDIGCTCGYWSFKSQELMKQALHGYVNSGIVVVGTVELWGRVIECENGYRSEYAYPKELWLLKKGLEYISWTYRVPVRIAKATEG